MNPTNRTRYRCAIKLTARELGAVSRFLARRTIAGDVALVDGVLREVNENARLEKRP